jgi:hypothetical protein
MGSFEVTCNGYLLFSKLALGYFPHITLLSNRVQQFIEDTNHGRDLHKYKGGLSPIKYNPNLKHSSSQSPEKPPSTIKSAHQVPVDEKPKPEEPKKVIKTPVEHKVENVQKIHKV